MCRPRLFHADDSPGSPVMVGKMERSGMVADQRIEINTQLDVNYIKPHCTSTGIRVSESLLSRIVYWDRCVSREQGICLPQLLPSPYTHAVGNYYVTKVDSSLPNI